MHPGNLKSYARLLFWISGAVAALTGLLPLSQLVTWAISMFLLGDSVNPFTSNFFILCSPVFLPILSFTAWRLNRKNKYSFSILCSILSLFVSWFVFTYFDLVFNYAILS